MKRKGLSLFLALIFAFSLMETFPILAQEDPPSGSPYSNDNPWTPGAPYTVVYARNSSNRVDILVEDGGSHTVLTPGVGPLEGITPGENQIFLGWQFRFWNGFSSSGAVGGYFPGDTLAPEDYDHIENRLALNAGYMNYQMFGEIWLFPRFETRLPSLRMELQNYAERCPHFVRSGTTSTLYLKPGQEAKLRASVDSISSIHPYPREAKIRADGDTGVITSIAGGKQGAPDILPYNESVSLGTSDHGFDFTIAAGTAGTATLTIGEDSPYLSPVTLTVIVRDEPAEGYQVTFEGPGVELGANGKYTANLPIGGGSKTIYLTIKSADGRFPTIAPEVQYNNSRTWPIIQGFDPTQMGIGLNYRSSSAPGYYTFYVDGPWYFTYPQFSGDKDYQAYLRFDLNNYAPLIGQKMTLSIVDPTTGAKTDLDVTFLASASGGGGPSEVEGSISLGNGSAPHINLLEETINPGFAVAAYSVNGGKKWKKGPLPTDKKLEALFNKGMELWVASAWNDKDVKDGKTVVAKKGVADSATVAKFPKIEKRPKANTEKLAPFYWPDNTNTWVLSKKGASSYTPPEKAYLWAESGDGKTPSGSWQSLPGGGWTLKEPGTKATFLFKSAAVIKDGSYIPASKTFRAKPSALLKTPAYKAPAEKKGAAVLKLKKGDFCKLGDKVYGSLSAPTTLNIVHTVTDDTKELPGGAALTIWKEATGKKPRSAEQTGLVMPVIPAPEAASP
ncbi:MAG: hypothetical protein FWG93_07695 [Oscillospiraceae bacterium]|nr:hypothetical protein [Oscillospiraceae bacterium]